MFMGRYPVPRRRHPAASQFGVRSPIGRFLAKALWLEKSGKVDLRYTYARPPRLLSREEDAISDQRSAIIDRALLPVDSVANSRKLLRSPRYGPAAIQLFRGTAAIPERENANRPITACKCALEMEVSLSDLSSQQRKEGDRCSAKRS